ncbi:nucleolar and coiled-body phosphoprotein 1-like isoform X2 [Xyrauchen texanus]|uniref:nucleolar and coiled-body phosphoprotein 1-like isoform X2 n=1 Tax=Xyrauchen texanus TaxID=154827 RepID=UPI002242B9E7|nr:nucleolar and coiled-body phosphoprotein 1-like isoform X2 [Xyrauchen texanus]
MPQGKAKKKLHYLQGEEKGMSKLRIKDVFSLRGTDNLFDDIDVDSDLGLSLRSPLPKSTGETETKESRCLSNGDQMKTPFKQVRKDALIQENGIQEGEIIYKESPFKDIAPIKTSSPIEMETGGGDAVDGVRLVADPLLFGVEDEEPIGGDLSKLPFTQQSEPVKESLSGVSLASPPKRLELRKATKLNAGSSSCMKTTKPSKAALQAIQCSHPDTKEDLLMDKDPSRLSPVLVQKNELQLGKTQQSKEQMAEDSEKRLSFQHKIKKALMPKSSCSRKPAAAPVPLPVDFEEDFMILDDEAPILFMIPRKPEVSRSKRPVPADSAKDSVPADPQSADQLLQSEEDINNQQGTDSKRNQAQIDSDKQKPQGKRRRASKKSRKGPVPHDVFKDRPDPVTQRRENRICDQSPSQTVQGNKVMDSSGKRNTKSKTSDLDELSDKDGNNAGGSHETPVPPVPSYIKKSSSSQRDRPGSKTKKESNKVITVAGSHTTNSVKSNKNGKKSRNGKAVSKTKKRISNQQKKLGQIDSACELQDVGEASLSLNEQEKAQRTAVNKKSSTKQGALKIPAKKLKEKETKTVESAPKDPSAMAPDTSSDSPVTCKRRRKPPGDWWLTSQDESPTECQSEPKTTEKQAAVVDSEETQSRRPIQGNLKKPETSVTNNAVESIKKVMAHGDDLETGAKQKMSKKTGVRKKRKSATTQQQVPSPTPGFGEELEEDRQETFVNESAEQVSPLLCSPYRQHNITPGENRVFDKVYTRDTGTAQKNPSSSLRRPESSVPDDVPKKRQRKAPSNWWEAPPSEEATDGPQPHNPPPNAKSKLPNSSISAVFNKGITENKSQKTKNYIKNIKRSIINTPKSIKRSLTSMNAIFASDKAENIVKSRQKRGRRNLLHSLEDQSEHSSENMAHSVDQLQGNRNASFGFTSGITVESSGTRKEKSIRASSGPNTLSDVDKGLRSGPSSMIDLQQHDEEDDIDLLSSRVTAHVRHIPRVLAQCDLCGPPLQPIILEEEDWNNLHAWFSHLWPPASKDGRVVSPDDFHWHSHGGRAIGHAVDLQSGSFSHGKILLGSFMKKPPQMDLDTVSVFSIISSCVRVDIDGVKSVYNSGQVFMIPSGQVYSIHNLCQEPAVLIYHRTQTSQQDD